MWTGLKKFCKKILPNTYRRLLRLKLNLSDNGRRHIFYYPDYKTIYLPIEKNAHSTLRTAFLNKLKEDDLLPAHAAGQDDRKFTISNRTYAELAEREEIFVFTFVRNPLSRVTSCYNYMIRQVANYTILERYPGFSQDMSFESFVRAICAIPDSQSDLHFRSQVCFVYPDNVDKVDFIGKTERFDTDIELVKKMTGITTFETVNQTKEPTPMHDLYTRELADMVYERYRKDFESFDYEEDYRDLIASLEE